MSTDEPPGALRALWMRRRPGPYLCLAGLAEDGHDDDALVPISMDYTVSTEQLYTKFAEDLIKAGYLPWALQQVCARRCTKHGPAVVGARLAGSAPHQDILARAHRSPEMGSIRRASC